MDRMHTLVIGADGLLGSHLVRKLLEAGHSVRVLRQPGSTSPTLDGLDLERVTGDLVDKGPSLQEAMEGCRFVFHCAAITDLWAAASLHFRVNLEGTRRVCDACLAAGVRRLVFVGSASSFESGSREQPGDETGPFPVVYRGVPYMESKHQAMKLVLQYEREHDLDAVVVSPTFLLGRYDARPSSGELIRQYLKGGLPFVPRGGRNFAYAPDVATAMVAALERGRRGRCYLLGGHNLSYREFFTVVAEQAGTRPPVGTIPDAAMTAAGWVAEKVGQATGRKVLLNRQLAKFAQLDSFYSVSRARQELDLPSTPVKRAIADSLGSLREYGHLPGTCRPSG